MINKNILINALKRYDSIMEACSKTGITRSTYYRWRENKDFRRITNLINMKSKQRPHFGMDVTTVKSNICPYCGHPVNEKFDDKRKYINKITTDIRGLKHLKMYTKQVRNRTGYNETIFNLLICVEQLINQAVVDKNRVLIANGAKPILGRYQK